MGYYFDDQESMFGQVGLHVEGSLAAISHRFVGSNPPHPPTFRVYSKRGIMRDDDFRYTADFNQVFPRAVDEQLVYAWAKYWTDRDSSLKFDVTCFGPVVVYCNGEVVFKSTIFQERYTDNRTSINIPIKAGWNQFVIRFKKTRAGFGGKFGTWLGKLDYYFLMPSIEREGQEGWIYTEPLSAELPVLPGPVAAEKDTGLTWLPSQEWSSAALKQGQLQRIYGLVPDAFAVGWAKALFLHRGKAEYTLKGRSAGPVSIFIGGEKVFEAREAGKFDAKVKAPFGHQDVMVKAASGAKDWGFELSILDQGRAVPFTSPCNITGTTQPWIYIGPFAHSSKVDPLALRDMNKVFPSIHGNTYWRVDLPDAWVRLYNENPLYGNWNYPLGVTIYGLLHSARAIGSTEIEKYIVDHIQFCCDSFGYALWDRDQYGGATAVHHLLASIDSLDDCGSFGSVVLEVAKYHKITGVRKIADFVADYISNEQIRLPDGTFFRKNLMHHFHEDTMWADDLYMSVPFLCRYYQLTGDRKYIDDAARQFLGFAKYLFLPELKVFSHVYDFKRDMATGVPWGRGNGWTIFSLSELLAVLPKDHAQRPALLDLFRTLSEGYLALQDEQGMWHQVLNVKDSYPETSCTSMFAYAFARGVQYGWLDQPDPYVRSVLRAWEAINRISIDKNGNIYGVCRGSEFSFTPEYYKNELSWNLNDTHGIGIVLLAGVEVLKLMKHLKK